MVFHVPMEKQLLVLYPRAAAPAFPEPIRTREIQADSTKGKQNTAELWEGRKQTEKSQRTSVHISGKVEFFLVFLKVIGESCSVGTGNFLYGISCTFKLPKCQNETALVPLPNPDVIPSSMRFPPGSSQ